MAVALLWLNCIGFFVIDPTIFGIVGVGWIIGLIAMLSTGKRERSATQPLIFTAGGFGIASDETTDASRTLQSWSEVNCFNLTRIGAKWYRLRIGNAKDPERIHTDGQLRSVKFEAGVRCDDDQANRVRDTITHHLRHYSYPPAA
ncbi:hypothetical protein [Algisphaera agarilytica]|uniref:Uncharacterized protein n=1 Tax=Algisphaera agarilytica TaxID=1385975 RepID=A0A7X0H429_9BACT|nr:hypothetical protein [Algisphaera agarilytica]MBB6428903.1 hypothetical protein [Algisphaera agarilytica]